MDGLFGAENGRAHVGDGLHDHAGDLQVGAVGAGFFEEAVDVDLFQPWDVSEGDGSP